MTKMSQKGSRRIPRMRADRSVSGRSAPFPFNFKDVRFGIGLTIILAGGVFLPTGLLKYLACVIGLVFTCAGGNLSRNQTRFVLGACFALSYIVLPYWKTPSNG